jgi:hypothetical protein
MAYYEPMTEQTKETLKSTNMQRNMDMQQTTIVCRVSWKLHNTYKAISVFVTRYFRCRLDPFSCVIACVSQPIFVQFSLPLSSSIIIVRLRTTYPSLSWCRINELNWEEAKRALLCLDQMEYQALLWK